jgi:hypothetical protein
VFHPSPALVLSIDSFVPLLRPNSAPCYFEKNILRYTLRFIGEGPAAPDSYEIHILPLDKDICVTASSAAWCVGNCTADTLQFSVRPVFLMRVLVLF